MCESFHDRQAHQISCCQVRNLVAWKTPKNGQNNLDVFSIVNSWDFWWAYIWEKRLPNFIISCHRLKGSNGGCSVPLCVCVWGGGVIPTTNTKSTFSPHKQTCKIWWICVCGKAHRNFKSAFTPLTRAIFFFLIDIIFMSRLMWSSSKLRSWEEWTLFKTK